MTRARAPAQVLTEVFQNFSDQLATAAPRRDSATVRAQAWHWRAGDARAVRAPRAPAPRSRVSGSASSCAPRPPSKGNSIAISGDDVKLSAVNGSNGFHPFPGSSGRWAAQVGPLPADRAPRAPLVAHATAPCRIRNALPNAPDTFAERP